MTGTCKIGFPKDPLASPYLCPVLDRWDYPRHGSEDAYIVNYHPAVLHLWGAHAHLQRATRSAWVNYLMKYVLKCEPNSPGKPFFAYAFELTW